jgi:hypothetical protein
MTAGFGGLPIRKVYPTFVLAPDEIVFPDILCSNPHREPPVVTCNYMYIYIQESVWVTLYQPGVTLYQPGVTLYHPGVTLYQPGVTLYQPGVTLYQSG